MRQNSCRFFPEGILYILSIMLVFWDSGFEFLRASVVDCFSGLSRNFRQQKTHSGKGQNGLRNQRVVVRAQMMLQAHL